MTNPPDTNRALVEAARRVHAAMCPDGEAEGFTYDKSSDDHKRYCDRIAQAALASISSPEGRAIQDCPKYARADEPVRALTPEDRP